MQSAAYVANEFLRLAKEDVAQSGQPHDMTPMKLLKLVYIAHGITLATRDEPLISEDIEAWTYGPVIPELYRLLKDYGSSPVEKIDFITSAPLVAWEQEIVLNVFKSYNKFTGPQLSSMTHYDGTPWHKVYQQYMKSPCSIVIPNDSIKDHYLGILQKSRQAPEEEKGGF